ncbi:helix-turn-helix domain-containing protein [Acidisoma cellulosilytica]|uniref:Helix-turn-helix domain-containing protein n=1 Tax=Acidisoma cellulosilyticum TaxID=2802395 RepID=A0A963Z6B0_9PROT|nr:XRE family transcriptional regulator [Acidisoma cellulosilyticum]MCB8883423.1 helix-turn-helix domain-containing protein [Acidisoma cellulosilyticum]
MDEAALITAFCHKLKEIRRSKDLTLDDLARISGVSISTISKIENQQQKPGFETVLKISRALHVNFVHMLDPPEPAPVKTTRRVVTRADSAPVYDSEHYVYAAHATELANKTMVPLLMRIKNRDLPPLADWSVHDGEEYAYVIEGEVALHMEHYAPVQLHKGDSCYFDSTMRHAYVALDGEAVVLSICLSIVPFKSEAPGAG